MTYGTTEPLQAGAVAPNFTLPSTAGQSVTLSSVRERCHVLLAFFPAAFTSVCTSEMCAFSDDFDAFSRSDVEVLPISVDNLPSLKEFKSKYALKVELLSDLRREVATAYGVLRSDSPVANRAYFLIDTGGVIRWAHVEEHPGLRRENAEILESIKNVIG
jgi:peroxiredoxin